MPGVVTASAADGVPMVRPLLSHHVYVSVARHVTTYVYIDRLHFDDMTCVPEPNRSVFHVRAALRKDVRVVETAGNAGTS